MAVKKLKKDVKKKVVKGMDRGRKIVNNMAIKNVPQTKHQRIKDLVDNARKYFRDNYERFHKFNKYVFESTLDSTQIAILSKRQMPTLEFNMVEAFLLRLWGEYFAQESGIEVRSAAGYPVHPDVIDIVEGYLRHKIDEANSNCMQYDVFQDTTAGGFSVIELWTDYTDEMGHDQDIFWARCFDPTLCGFDPLARQKTKSDAQYWYKLTPKSKAQFEAEFEDIDLTVVKFTRTNTGYNWSYTNDNSDIILVCEFFEKVVTPTKIVKLAPDWFKGPYAIQSDFKPSMTMKDYEAELEAHKEQRRTFQPPALISSRMTDITSIEKTTFIETQIIEEEETDYPGLNGFFVDGNSRLVKETNSQVVKQMTRPLVYNTVGVQNLKNYAGQTLANKLENMDLSQWLVPDEALPSQPQYLAAWTNPQKAEMLVHKTFKNNDPQFPLPQPREVSHPPAPPEIMATFQAVDSLFQMILGSYDSALGINDNQLSGSAIFAGGTQSNAASMPFQVGNLQALQKICEMTIKMIPKYIKTARTIPIIDKFGKRDFKVVNQEGGIYLNYDCNALHVEVKATASFAMQKQMALKQLIAMMQASPIFAQFMNTKGLMVLIDNMDLRGVDKLKIMAEQFQQEMAQQMQQSQQQPNPDQMKMQMQAQETQQKMQLEQQKLQQRGQESQAQNAVDMAKVSVAKDQSDTERMHVLLEARQANMENLVQIEKAQTEKTVHALDYATKHIEHGHNKHMDHLEMAHKIASAATDSDHKNADRLAQMSQQQAPGEPQE